MPDTESCPTCGPADEPCCSLEAVVSVDERGQLVLPKDLRIRAGIAAGDRFALVSYRGEDGDICCISLVKTDAMAGAVRSIVAPALGLDG